MQKFLDYASWGFIAVLALPTVMIIATWSSVPGDLGYGIKRAFEGALLVMARPSYDAEASLNAQYTKRRMEEAKALLAKNQSSEGLTQLSAQITATKKMIDRAPTQEKKRAAAQQYIATLQGVSKELRAQQSRSRTSAGRNRQTAAITNGDQLQANLQMQLEQIEALQQQLQQQIQTQPQAQQLLAQLSLQAQQLRQLQQQVAQADTTPTQGQIQEIVAQLSATQDQTQAVAEQITPQEDAQQPQEDDAIDTSLASTEEQIQEIIAELESIAQADNNPVQNADTLLDQVKNKSGRSSNAKNDNDDDDSRDNTNNSDNNDDDE